MLNYSFDLGVDDFFYNDLWKNDLIDDETLSQLASTAGPLLDDYDDETLTLVNAAGPLLDYDDDLFGNEACTSTSTRFATATSADDITGIIKSAESKNTRKTTTWAVKVFDDWRNARNERPQARHIPVLNVMSSQQLDTYLSHFILEARRLSVYLFVKDLVFVSSWPNFDSLPGLHCMERRALDLLFYCCGPS